MSFENASVIITGGSKGIGLSIAKVFARETSRRIVLIARNHDDLETAKKECLAEGAKGVEILAADLSNPNALDSMDFQSLNPGILINNAGSFLFKPLSNTNSLEFEHQFKINTQSAFITTEAVLPTFRDQERALIVNICSQASIKGYSHSGAYTMSKHALLGYTRSLRQELLDTNIAVTAINLGQTFSTSWEGVEIDPNHLIDPDDVGKIILSLSNLSANSVVEEIILMPQGGETKPM
jgi:short-subunit dehydrogenase